MDSAPTSDADIDDLLGDTFAKVGMSPAVIEASRRLEKMLADAKAEPVPKIDPRTIPVRFTRLKELFLSAAHYHLACQDERSDSIALRMGSAFHASLFANRKVLCYPGRRAGKAWQRFEMLAKEERAVVLNEPEYRIAMGMVGSVRRHERAMEILFDATTTEMRIDWQHGDRACQSTPDAFKLDHWLGELKSARCTEPKWLAREALRRHYHCQLGFYGDAIEAFAGRRPPEEYIVAVENAAPFNVTVLRLPDETKLVAAKLNHKWFADLRRAETLGYYGGYVESDVDLVLPEYRDTPEPVVVEIDGELVTID